MAVVHIYIDCYLNTLRLGKFHFSDGINFREFVRDVICHRSGVVDPKQLVQIQFSRKDSDDFILNTILQISDLHKVDHGHWANGKYVLDVKFLRDSEVAMLNVIDEKQAITLFRRPSEKPISITIGPGFVIHRIFAPNGTEVDFRCADRKLTLVVSMTGVYEIYLA